METPDTKDPVGEWATVRAAAAKAGVSTSAVRKWYRNNTVRSQTVAGPHGPQRMVAMADVAARRDAWDGRPFTPAELRVPDGQVLVPVEAWERVLRGFDNLTGNWHDLSVQLADARADAAAAKTKVEFLEERLRDLRAAEAADVGRRRRWGFRRDAGAPGQNPGG